MKLIEYAQHNQNRETKRMYYQIRVQGHLDPSWSEWFEPLTITNADHGEALLAGELADQAALHGMLIKVRDLGLPLVAVQQIVESQEARARDDPAQSGRL
jgi:hypothetical protein